MAAVRLNLFFFSIGNVGLIHFSSLLMYPCILVSRLKFSKLCFFLIHSFLLLIICGVVSFQLKEIKSFQMSSPTRTRTPFRGCGQPARPNKCSPINIPRSAIISYFFFRLPGGGKSPSQTRGQQQQQQPLGEDPPIPRQRLMAR